MAKLTKEQYRYRNESAANYSMNNERVAVENGMTEEQVKAISKLCSIRHYFHCNIEHIAKSDEGKILNKLVQINSELRELGLPYMDFIPAYDDDYIDIDTISERAEFARLEGNVIDDYQEWYDENFEEVYEELSNLHKLIENYIKSIDEKYHTSWTPTGALRIM